MKNSNRLPLTHPSQDFVYDRLLTTEDVLKITGLKSRVSLWRKSKDQTDSFPSPYKIGTVSKRWKLSEIESWMNQLKTA